MTLEAKITNLLADAPENATFEIVAHELWGNCNEGFEVNSSWFLARNADMGDLLRIARGRWEAFKTNYLPHARVADIEDTGFDDTFSLAVDSVPFLEIHATLL